MLRKLINYELVDFNQHKAFLESCSVSEVLSKISQMLLLLKIICTSNAVQECWTIINQVPGMMKSRNLLVGEIDKLFV